MEHLQSANSNFDSSKSDQQKIILNNETNKNESSSRPVKRLSASQIDVRVSSSNIHIKTVCAYFKLEFFIFFVFSFYFCLFLLLLVIVLCVY